MASTPKCESVLVELLARSCALAAPLSPARAATPSAASGRAAGTPRSAGTSKSIASAFSSVGVTSESSAATRRAAAARRRRRPARSRRDSSRRRRREGAGAPGRSSSARDVVLAAAEVERPPCGACPPAAPRVPERRRRAPAEAPVKSSVPAMNSATPTISAPVSPITCARPPPRAPPMAPPSSRPSAIMSPNAPTASPVRNGFRSTSLLRTSISPPTPTSTTGIDVGGDAEGAVRARRRRRAPTGPPSQPSQSTVARKRPTATIPSPHSSGWWCDRVFGAALLHARRRARLRRPLDWLLPRGGHRGLTASAAGSRILRRIPGRRSGSPSPARSERSRATASTSSIGRRTGAFPWGIFVVNITGAFLIGVAVGGARAAVRGCRWVRLAVVTGFLGAYTTFSTLLARHLPPAREGQIGQAVFNAFGTLVPRGLLAVVARAEGRDGASSDLSAGSPLGRAPGPLDHAPPRPGCRSPRVSVFPPRGPCRPGRSARSRPGTRAGCRGCR